MICARSGFDTAAGGLLNHRWSSEVETRPSEVEARLGFDTAADGLLNHRWSSEAEAAGGLLNHRWPSEAEARLGFDTAAGGPLNHRAGLERPDYVVDRRDERAHVVGLDRGEGCDAQLVASEFAVRVGVDDSVCAQRLGDSRRIHVV